MGAQEHLSEVVKVSTKACACGNTRLIKLQSYNLKHCSDCYTDIPWLLDEGQKPLNGSHRAGRKLKDQDPCM